MTSQKTPLASVRRGGAWLSRLAAPMGRLFSHSGQKLFGTLSHKRINSANDSIRMKDNGFTDIVKLLKEKTYTRSEVDQLTTFLRSKAANVSTVNEDQRNKVLKRRSSVLHKDIGSVDCLRRLRPKFNLSHRSFPWSISETPLSISASGGQNSAHTSKDSPEDIPGSSLNLLPSQSSGITSKILQELDKQVSEVRHQEKEQRPQENAVAASELDKQELDKLVSKQRPQKNAFVTPRSQGRSAVNRKAITQHYVKGLKRRSTELDKDIGYAAPIRRIRPKKPNLLFRSLDLPASGIELFVCASCEKKSTHASKESAKDTPVLCETASKILQEIDKKVSEKEKSRCKVSRSMLRGPVRNRLQNVDLPKLDNLPEKKENSPGSSNQKQEKSTENGAREDLSLGEKTGGAVDGTNKTGSSKDQDTHVNDANLPLTSSMKEDPPKKRGFRICADDEDDEVY